MVGAVCTVFAEISKTMIKMSSNKTEGHTNVEEDDD